MQTVGELINDKIIITNASEIGRLYDKSHFGKIVQKKDLELNLLEGVFLLGEEKIRIFKNKKEIDFETLFKLASKKIYDFEIKYLLFKDIRSRGHAIKLCSEKENGTFSSYKKDFVIYAISERDRFDINKIKNEVESNNKNRVWFGIVDEEGDITYYEVSIVDICGKNKEYIFKKSKGYLFENRVIIFDEKISKALLDKEFLGKTFGKYIQLSLVEALYLSDKNFLDVFTIDETKLDKNDLENIFRKFQPDIKQRHTIFIDLKKRGLIVKTGFKFGAHFRAYTSTPDDKHAEYLIHIIDKDFSYSWAEISRAVRLAHSVNKEIAFALINNKKIEFIKFGRLRP